MASILGVVLFSLAGSPSTPIPPRVRFVYETPDRLESCPDGAALRAGVRGRLGYDPFDATADEELKVRLQRSGRELEALITIADDRGQVRAERRLVSRQGDCAELASSVELAVSIAIDPFHGAAQPEPEAVRPEPEAAPVPSAPAPAPAPEMPSTPASAETSGQLLVGALVGQGTAPAPTLGFTLGGSVRRGRWSLGLQARADLPGDHDLVVGSIRTTSWTGSLVPCAHFHEAAACVVFTAGALRAQGRGLAEARHITRPYVAAGARLAYALPLSRRLSLLLHADVTTPLAITELQVDYVGKWTTPPVAAALGIALGMSFP